MQDTSNKYNTTQEIKTKIYRELGYSKSNPQKDFYSEVAKSDIQKILDAQQSNKNSQTMTSI